VLYANVALAYVNMQMYDEGIRSARRQIDIASMLQLSPNGRIFARASALSVLANALRLQGDLEGALKAIREARGIVDRSTSSNETQRMLDRYGILLREGFILGEDRGVSLERPEEAIAPLREAFDMTEALARRDPNEVTSRTRVGTSGRELGDILRWRDPQEAMAIYDVALRRLGEVHNNVRARRDRALVLVNSSYALRRLNRPGEAKRRIDEAFTILTETKDYPSDRISLDSELRAVLQALADHHADERQPVEAIDGYEQLLQKVLASEPDVENDLRDAYSLALLYGDLARLYRSAGRSEQAAATDAENLALWRHWDRKLPDNAFVARRLAELRD
jgi:tetratricopeptide (TPR) repeat protein